MLWNVLLLHRMMSGMVFDLLDISAGKFGPKCVNFCPCDAFVYSVVLDIS